MDEVLMRFGVLGFCPDCGEDRLLVPVDELGFELCCTDCDGAVLLLHLSAPMADPVSGRRAS